MSFRRWSQGREHWVRSPPPHSCAISQHSRIRFCRARKNRMLHTCHAVFGYGIQNITDEQVMVRMSMRQERNAGPCPVLLDIELYRVHPFRSSPFRRAPAITRRGLPSPPLPATRPARYNDRAQEGNTANLRSATPLRSVGPSRGGA